MNSSDVAEVKELLEQKSQSILTVLGFSHCSLAVLKGIVL